MRKQYRYLFLGVLVLIISAGVLSYAWSAEKVSIDNWNTLDRVAAIHPDYTGAVIPPNIAPLNFKVKEDGSQYFVKIRSKNGRAIEVSSKTGKIVIPEKPWHRLLEMNKGEDLYFDIFVKTNNQWNLYSSVTNKIATEPIDSYLVYRKIHPTHNLWMDMGIYQRNLQNYDETCVLDSRDYKNGCSHCHEFSNNRTDRMSVGIRSGGNSLLLVENGVVKKIGATFGFTSWHPSGRMIVCSINQPKLLIHSVRNDMRDIVDVDSLLAYYIVASNTVKTSPQISRKDRLETYPAWSPDGRYLYFCSAPVLWSDRNKLPPDRYNEVKYDLVRISYDIESDKWGELETVLSAQDTGLSIIQPRISPNGRWALVSMCEYSCWPTYHASSDLYMIDLQSVEQSGRYEYRRLEINSDQCESWHSWSSNGRWIVFSSKKGNHLFNRPYIAYVDEAGNTYKAVLLPQKDPEFFDSCLRTYTIPELVIEPVKVTGEKLASVIRSSDQIKVDMPVTMATPQAGKAAETGSPYQEGQ